MSWKEKLKHEVRAILALTLYFGSWIAGLLTIKSLILAEYHIAFGHFSMALVGALILSKVVLILQHVSLGSWVRNQPAWLDVALRTLLYAVGVFLVLVLEKGLEGRHEHDGFGGALTAAFQSTDAAHVWANVICVSGALLLYNAAVVVKAHLGRAGLLKLFLVPVPPAAEPPQSPGTLQTA